MYSYYVNQILKRTSNKIIRITLLRKKCVNNVQFYSAWSEIYYLTYFKKI